MNFSQIEKKWQNAWEKAKIFQAKEKGKKYYVLEMFPYPSASYLHIGHVRNYSIGDSFARFKRMNGFNVLYPIGYDSFGLPAENAAKKEKIHPKEYTEKAIKKIQEYMKKLGLSYDWSRLIATHTKEYYQWNQWFFLKFFEKGLAYRKKAPVNWCPKCNTVLANEEVESGKCWRCKAEVETKQLDQWFFKTTEYVEELLKEIDNLEWSDKLKLIQKNWIGKSPGLMINFKVDGKDWPIFTTRPDTIYGVTFMAIALNHPKLLEMVKGTKYEKDIQEFIKKSQKHIGDEDWLEKQGVFTGKYAVNPVNNEKIPIYAANFVLAEYGTGMIMAVPAHDQRDFEFAKKFKIPIRVVINPASYPLSPAKMSRAFTGEGNLTNSGKFNGSNNKDAIEEITAYIVEKKFGKKTFLYRIRDWLISRQRYWGTPIPIIYCDKCGAVPAKLPVLLPEDVNFSSKGNPLLTSKKFLETKCPKCGGKGRRETDTMGGFMDSSWYFLRYCDPNNKNLPFDKKKVDYWMPVDQYVGGIEHAVGHLIYARFFTKALRDLGLLKIKEPFLKLFNQGIVYKDGKRMSKSQGNTVTQDEISKKHGVDTARLFLLFVAAPDSDMEYSEKGIEGAAKFVRKVYEMRKKKFGKLGLRGESTRNKTILEVTEDIEKFRFNLAIIKLMKFANYLEDKDSYLDLVKMLSIFCPHICEEIWKDMKQKGFVSVAKWPIADKKKINKKFEEQDGIVDKLTSDINNILRIIDKKVIKAFVYVLPKELELFKEALNSVQKSVSVKVQIFAVNDPKKYDPENKSKKTKPGKPAIYLE
ncbi:MAG: leucine--tRNA ligase [archaeon]